MKKLFFFVLVLVFLIPFTLSAQAPTYDAVTNGTFDTDISDWTVGTTTGQFHSDTGGNPPGSIAIVPVGGTNVESFNTCFPIPVDYPVVGGTRYMTLEWDVFNTNSSVQAIVSVLYFTDTGCTAGGFDRFQTALHHSDDWQTFPPDPTFHNTFALPPSMQSVQVRLSSLSTTAAYDMAFDNVRAFSSTPNAITLASMNATSGMGRIDTTIAVLLAGSAGFLALAVLFRRRLIHQGD